MCGPDGLLCAGDKLVETSLTTGQDRTPGTGGATLLLALTEQSEISDCETNNAIMFSPPTQTFLTRFSGGILRMTETFSKLAYRRHARDICTDKYQYKSMYKL